MLYKRLQWQWLAIDGGIFASICIAFVFIGGILSHDAGKICLSSASMDSDSIFADNKSHHGKMALFFDYLIPPAYADNGDSAKEVRFHFSGESKNIQPPAPPPPPPPPPSIQQNASTSILDHPAKVVQQREPQMLPPAHPKSKIIKKKNPNSYGLMRNDVKVSSALKKNPKIIHKKSPKLPVHRQVKEVPSEPYNVVSPPPPPNHPNVHFKTLTPVECFITPVGDGVQFSMLTKGVLLTKCSQLINPPRYLIKMEGRYALHMPRLPKNSIITKIRIGNQMNGHTHLVLDLARPAQVDLRRDGTKALYLSIQ